MALNLCNNFYVRLHFQARGGASSLHHRNHTKITVLWVNSSPVRYDFHGSAKAIQYQGRIQGEGAGSAPPPPPEMTCGFLMQLVFCKKKKNLMVYWC